MPNTIVVTYSELDAYRQCPLKWALAYQQRWSKEAVEGGALSRGTLWHQVMEVHYTAIAKARRREDGTWLARPKPSIEAAILQAAQAAVFNSGLLGIGAEQSEQQELVQWMYAGYVNCYGIDRDWEILAIETPGVAWLLTERGGRSRFRLAYKFDLTIFDHSDRQYKIVDHKSAKDFSRPAEIDIDDQFALYWWAEEQQKRRRKYVCVIRSDARTQRNKSPMRMEDRFRRIPTHRTPHERSNIALDAYRAATAAYASQSRVYSSPDPRQCGWKCDFLAVHLAMRKGIAKPAILLRDHGFTQREDKHREYNTGEIQEVIDGREEQDQAANQA